MKVRMTWPQWMAYRVAMSRRASTPVRGLSQWEKRDRAMRLANVRKLEEDLDRDLARATTWSDAWWAALGRLDRARSERIVLEA